MRAVFHDRVDAGVRLGEEIARRGLDADGPVVLGIPRGGVIVAAAAAATVGAPLGVALAHKIGAPDQPELALGAVGPDGTIVLDKALVARLHVPWDWLDRSIATERRALLERAARLPEWARKPKARGRTVIVVDDGVATGATASACGRWLGAHGAARRVLAVPVAPSGSLRRLVTIGSYDDAWALETPRDLLAVGEAYEDFAQVSDADVLTALRAAAPPGSSPA